MERLERLTRFWQWLPAFRVVAETLHLPTAAEILGVGPSALSRSVRMLEESVGVPLFEKQGRRLALTAKGGEFLHAVRDAMRFTDDGLSLVRSEHLRGPLRIASGGAITTAYVVPALLGLQKQHPELVPRISSQPPDAVGSSLLRGELDVAFQDEPSQGDPLESVPLGSMGRRVYCGRSHPCFGSGPHSIEDLGSHGFVTPLAQNHGAIDDGWPPTCPRTIAMQVDQMRVGCDIVESGALLAVLPDALALRRGLHPLVIDGAEIPNVNVFAVRRRGNDRALRADQVVIEAVRDELTRATTDDS